MVDVFKEKRSEIKESDTECQHVQIL